MKPLNLEQKIPFDKTCLIEASAGTGKTFSIERVFLQAILQGMPIEKILVVTFTEAATKELKSRIREILQKALYCIDKKDDETINKIFELYKENDTKEKIKTAILAMDRASIFTMHSFCQRMLTENAFESKISYGAELITDTEPITKEMAENFWRENFVAMTPEEKEKSDVSFDNIKKLFNTLADKHETEATNNEIEINDVIKDRHSWIKKFDDSSFINEIKNFFLGNETFLKKNYGADLEKRINEIKDSFVYLKKTTGLKNFAYDDLSNCYKKNGKDKGLPVPTHDLFDYCDAFYETILEIGDAANLHKIKTHNKIHAYIKTEYSKIKEERNILTFNDLINRLHKSLKQEENNGALTKLIQSKFKLALVDEFQDTDNIQYEIFEHLFNSENHGFFMIGDPKQSIYKFRNADIFSYLSAKKNADEEYTLDSNYRSEENMVKAVNDFFSFKENVFAIEKQGDTEGISFTPVLSKSPKANLIINETENDKFLNIWLANGEEENEIEKTLSNEIAKKIIYLMKLSEEGKAYFDDGNKTKLQLSDFSIIVDIHAQADLVKKSLVNHKIPAVTQGKLKIFDSIEASDIETWIQAIINPIERNIRKCFITNLLYKSANEIDNITDSELFFLTEQFTEIGKTWLEKGFLYSFSSFIEIFEIKEKNLKFINGERVISNYLHLAELLHTNELKEGNNINRALSYLQFQIANESKDDEEVQRLESDKNSVRIITSHKSKGLEFPIVFYPFAWNKAITKGEGKQAILSFTEQINNKFEQKLDFGAYKGIRDANNLKARKETLAENIRLLYVALTRARNRCYLGIGNIEKTAKSIFSYIFTDKNTSCVEEKFLNNHATYKANRIEVVEEIEKTIISLENEAIKILPIEKSKEANETLKKAKENQNSFQVEELKNKPKQDWGLGSFSGLTRNANHHTEKTKVGKGIFGLPKGNIFGLAIHEILENYFTVGKKEYEANEKRYFKQPLKTLSDYRTTDEKLNSQRFETTKEMINNVLETKINNNIILGEIEPKDTKAELDFFYEIKNISPKILKDIFNKHIDEDIKDFSKKLGSLHFQLEKGYMAGQIDMLFRKDYKYFVLDWKTNHLGATANCYDRKAMLKSMKDSYYILQYHIYSLATHLYLKNKLKDYDYDKHFGGSYYIYTRGIGDKDNGIFFDKPPKSLILELEAKLTKGEK